MNDVAAVAGVSLKTVSRVFNGVTSVDEKLAARVFAAADSLAFIPNMAAQTLRKKEQRTHQLAAIFTDPNNPFIGTWLATMQRVAHESGSLLLAATTGKQSDLEPALVRAFATRRVDGIILFPTNPSQAYLQPRLDAGLPVVCVDRAPVEVETDVVASANRLGAREAVQHLLAHGHRRIAYMGDTLEIATATDRHKGYLDAMQGAGVPVDPSCIIDDLRTSWQAEAATLEMFSRADHPTALFTSQNLVTIGALQGLRTLGLRSTVAHVGFDEVPLAGLLDPPLTVVAQNLESIAETAMDLLMSRVGDASRPVRRITVPTALIRRGSGELRPPKN